MKHPVLPVFTLCALAAAVSGAWAQSATDAPAADPQSTTLPAVKVRAAAEESATGPVKGFRAKNAMSGTKTDTPIRETPQSITVVTRDQIVETGAINVQDALNYAAGVRSDAYGLDTRTDSARIRGADPVSYLDGLRSSFNWYTSQFRADPYMLERIEVLRGPAGMLFGQGGTGGIVNLVSKRPQAEASREIGVQIGSHDRKQVQADLTGALTQDGEWLYRIIGVGRQSDTQVDYVEDDRALLAPSLTWRPTANTSLTLQALVQRDRTGSSSQFLPWSAHIATSVPNPNGPVPTSRFIGEPSWDRYDTDRESFGWQLEHRLDDAWKLRQNARYAQNEVTYRSQYANYYSSPAFSPDPAQREIGRFAYANDQKVKIAQLDQNVEGHLKTGSVSHVVLGGLDYIRSDSTGRSGFLSAAAPIDVYAPVYGNVLEPVMGDVPKEVIRQTGLYAQDQLTWGRWIGIAGLRYDSSTKSVAGSPDEDADALTKRFGVMYEVIDGLRPFISYSESFTPQSNMYGISIDPLKGKQWEVGVKYEPANAGYMVAATVYDLRESGRVTGTTATDLRQLDDTKNKGYELEARGRVTNALDMIASYTYTHVDDELEAVPARQASVWSTYRFAAAGIPGFSAGAGVRFLSRFHDGVAPEVPSVTLFDAMVAWDSDAWRVALNVNNVADRTYVSTCLGRGDCWWGARRNAVATVSYKF